ncbi:alpha/beta hydrolase [Gracilimonas sediminicola]|uniref:Esterase family protein n=1 Tax=Gracilimonas sediminicola TaxID=2952158 RepID=A0A9X2L1J6_9BACT|nr:alpha/beta hydrolase-fold protein [Gracilimonas sediminicola]MCP9290582.1 esterase family protein [Gracilimonas sediminicola]
MVIEVFVPEDYDPDSTYPLLLLNDGEDMFGGGSWGMDRVLQRLISDQKIKPVIAAAIYNQGQRMNWYIPYEDRWITTNWGPYTPSASGYAQDIFDYVIPYMDEHFSVDTSEVAIMGASLGGLISTWMGLKFPEKIKYSAGLSGSLWVADYSIFSEVEGSYDSGQKFWFDIGTTEWNYYVPLYTELDKHGVTPGENSFYYEVPNAAHVPSDWLQRIHLPLLAFFSPKTNPVPESLEVVLECIPSQSTPGRHFRRLNPIITLTNGVEYSLAHTASYSVLSGDAELGSEGSFRNNPQTEIEILVEYDSFSEAVDIPVGWCP